MSEAFIAACHVERKAHGLPHQASLIVCPPTLVAHWPHEIAKFVGSDLVLILQVRPLIPKQPSCRADRMSF